MAEIQGLITGLHHITLITANQDVNGRFYTEVIGLRRVKQTVNQDDVFHRHLFYGDHIGSPGSIITFFEWPHLPRGRLGVGLTHHIAWWARSSEAVFKWATWLRSKGVQAVGPISKDGKASLYFRDPDGVVLEISSDITEDTPPEYFAESEGKDLVVNSISDDMKLQRFGHAAPIGSDADVTTTFYNKFLGVDRLYIKPNPCDPSSLAVGYGAAQATSFLTYLVYPDRPGGELGIGTTHHIAFAVKDEEDQKKIRNRLASAGWGVTPVIDRMWFKSIYFRDPDGVILEVATEGPGFVIDEPEEKLGSTLVLPPWLEEMRDRIEKALGELDQKKSAAPWPPSFRPPPDPPEALH